MQLSTLPPLLEVLEDDELLDELEEELELLELLELVLPPPLLLEPPQAVKLVNPEATPINPRVLNALRRLIATDTDVVCSDFSFVF